MCGKQVSLKTVGKSRTLSAEKNLLRRTERAQSTLDNELYDERLGKRALMTEASEDRRKRPKEKEERRKEKDGDHPVSCPCRRRMMNYVWRLDEKSEKKQRASLVGREAPSAGFSN